MKLTHVSLCELGKLIGYPALDEGGMCRGFSVMLALAILTNNENDFYERLDLIEGYQKDFTQLLKNIDQIRHQLSMDRQYPLNTEEWKKLEVAAFFEGALVCQKPFDNKSHFNNAFITQENIKAIYTLIHPQALENQALSILIDREWVFDLSGLEHWLADLANILSQTTSQVPIVIDGPNHSVCFKYNKEKQCWVFTDTNDFNRFPDEKKYYRELTTAQFAQSIFTSFFDDVTGNTVFTTTALAINPDENLKKSIDDLDLKHTITAKQAHCYNTNGIGLLYIAAQCGHVDEVNKLIEFGAEINKTTNDDGATPLYIAAQNGYCNVISILLESGADVDQVRNDGITPLFIAAQNGHINAVSILIKFDAEINKTRKEDGVTPLFIAAQQGHLDVVRKLLESGAKANQARNDGTTPLSIARKKGYVDIVNLLERASLAETTAPSVEKTPLKIAPTHSTLFYKPPSREKITNGAKPTKRPAYCNEADINDAKRQKRD